MMRKTFNLRLSDAERQQMEIEAKKRGWSLGRYIRYKALPSTPMEEQIELILQGDNLMEKLVGKLENDDL